MALPQGGGGGGFTPSDLGAALVAWFRFGFFSDAGSTPSTDGGIVQQYSDETGNGNHLVQLDGARQGTYRATGLNGFPGVQFPNTGDQSMRTAAASAVLGGTTASVFMVLKYAAPVTSNGRFFSISAGGFDGGSVANAVMLRFSGASNIITAERNGSGLSASGTLTAGTVYRIGSVFDGVNHTLYVNGVAQSPVANSGTFGSPQQLFFNQDSDGGETPNSTLGETLFLSSAPDSTTIANIDTWLKNEYGL
jgi:hypothetical protein